MYYGAFFVIGLATLCLIVLNDWLLQFYVGRCDYLYIFVSDSTHYIFTVKCEQEAITRHVLEMCNSKG